MSIYLNDKDIVRIIQRKIVISFCFFVLIVGVAAYSLYTYVAILKPWVEKSINKQTGYHATIDSISVTNLSIFSLSEIKLTNLIIKDKSDKIILVKIKSVFLSMPLYSLFLHKLVMTKIHIDKVMVFNLNLSEKIKKITIIEVFANIFKQSLNIEQLHSVLMTHVMMQHHPHGHKERLKRVQLTFERLFKTFSLKIEEINNQVFSVNGKYQQVNKNKLFFSNLFFKENQRVLMKFNSAILSYAKDALDLEMISKHFFGGLFSIYYSIKESLIHKLIIKGKRITVTQLLKLFSHQKMPIHSGDMDLDIELSSHGKLIHTIINDFSGRIYLHSKNIKLIHVNLHLLERDIVFAIVSGLMPDSDHNKHNKLTCFTLNAPIHHGVIIFNKHLVMETKAIVMTSKGSLSLPKWSIDLELFPVPRKEVIMSLASFAHNISIKGSLFSPNIKVNSSLDGLLKLTGIAILTVETHGLALLPFALYRLAVNENYHPCLDITR